MEWISVKDRLPKPQQGILFCTKTAVYIGIFWGENKYVNGNMAGCYDEDVRLTEITHWMPLPKPPSNE